MPDKKFIEKAKAYTDFFREEYFALLESGIDRDDAMAHIKYYRSSAPAGAVKTITFGPGIIEYIQKNPQCIKMTGLRIYVARYNGVNKPVGNKDRLTAIVVPTIDGNGNPADYPLGYYNYGSPCPPDTDCGDSDGNP